MSMWSTRRCPSSEKPPSTTITSSRPSGVVNRVVIASPLLLPEPPPSTGSRSSSYIDVLLGSRSPGRATPSPSDECRFVSTGLLLSPLISKSERQTAGIPYVHTDQDPGRRLMTSSLTMQDIADLARVRRAVVSLWRRRTTIHGRVCPFPAPERVDDGVERFAVEDVVAYLADTGRGTNADTATDAPTVAAPVGTDLDSAVTLLCLAALSGEE